MRHIFFQVLCKNLKGEKHELILCNLLAFFCAKCYSEKCVKKKLRLTFKQKNYFPKISVDSFEIWCFFMCEFVNEAVSMQIVMRIEAPKENGIGRLESNKQKKIHFSSEK